jgi:hypothetical protein
VIGLPSAHKRQSGPLRQARRVSDTSVRYHLPEAVLAIIDEACAGFDDRPALGARVHCTGLQLVQVREQHLESVGVDAPQVGCDQGVGHR